MRSCWVTISMLLGSNMITKNDRILELAKQVWTDPNISHTNHLKFAELIVKECADIATMNSHQWEPPGHYVRTHFGIEE